MQTLVNLIKRPLLEPLFTGFCCDIGWLAFQHNCHCLFHGLFAFRIFDGKIEMLTLVPFGGWLYERRLLDV